MDYKPEVSFEKPFPVPEPVAAVIWPWLPGVPVHSLDTWVLLAHVGIDTEQKPSGTWGPAEASISPRDEQSDDQLNKCGNKLDVIEV